MKKLLPCILLLLLSACHSSETVDAAAAGSMDVSRTAFDSIPEIKVSNKWDFYLDSYFTSDSILQISKVKPTLAVKFPGTWREKYFSPNHLPSKAYGTYHLTLLLNKDSKDSLGMLLPDIYPNAEIWVNGVLKEKRGKFSRTETVNNTRIDPILIALPKTQRVDIYMPVSCYSHRMGGGMLSAPIIGKYQYLEYSLKKRIVLESVSAMIVLLITFFSLLHYTVVSRKRIFLFFGLMCFFGMLRQITIGIGLVSFFAPELPLEWIQAVRYIGFYLGLAFGTLYVNALYPAFFSLKISRYIFYTALLFTIYILVAPAYYASYAAIPFQLFALTVIIYTLYRFALVIKGKSEKSVLTAISLLIFISTIINDILYAQFFIKTGYIQHIGFLIFALMQLVVMMTFYKKQNYEISNLNQELDQKNKNINYLANDNVSRRNAKTELIQQIESLVKSEAQHNISTSLKKLLEEYKTEALVEANSQSADMNAVRIHSGFISKLRSLYPSLTKTEIEICLYIHLNLSNKEIAVRRKTSDTSIKVAKHRIRTKMNVSTSQELEELLVNL